MDSRRKRNLMKTRETRFPEFFNIWVFLNIFSTWRDVLINKLIQTLYGRYFKYYSSVAANSQKPRTCRKVIGQASSIFRMIFSQIYEIWLFWIKIWFGCLWIRLCYRKFQLGYFHIPDKGLIQKFLNRTLIQRVNQFPAKIFNRHSTSLHGFQSYFD